MRNLLSNETQLQEGHRALGTNATNYENIEVLIKLVKCFQRKEDLKEESLSSVFISNFLFHIFVSS